MTVAAPLSSDTDISPDPITTDLLHGDDLEITQVELIDADPHEPIAFVKEPVFPFVVIGTISFVAIIFVAYVLAMGAAAGA